MVALRKILGLCEVRLVMTFVGHMKVAPSPYKGEGWGGGD